MQNRRVPLTALGFLAAGIVIGFLVGGLGPRLDVERRDEEIADLERRLDEADTGGWRSPVPGLDRILRAPQTGERPLPPVGPREPGELPPPQGLGEVAPVSDGGVEDVRPRWRERWREQSAPQERLAAFRRAASLQRVRRLQSRAALQQQADLTGGEMVEVDEALRAMNEELFGNGEELILLAMSDEPPEARDLLGITHDVTGILHRAQLQLERIVGPERLGQVDPSALEIWNHVDLAQLEPAAESAMRDAP